MFINLSAGYRVVCVRARVAGFLARVGDGVPLTQVGCYSWTNRNPITTYCLPLDSNGKQVVIGAIIRARTTKLWARITSCVAIGLTA